MRYSTVNSSTSSNAWPTASVRVGLFTHTPTELFVRRRMFEALDRVQI